MQIASSMSFYGVFLVVLIKSGVLKLGGAATPHNNTYIYATLHPCWSAKSVVLHIVSGV
jgi:hypothetical protein